MFSSGSGPVILEARGESKSWGLYNFFLIHIGNSYVNMMLLKIKKKIITETRIIIGIRGSYVNMMLLKIEKIIITGT
jgi:hypothetical protein